MLTPVFLQFSVTKTARLRLEKSKYSPPDEVVESTESLIVISVLIAFCGLLYPVRKRLLGQSLSEIQCPRIE